MSHQHSFVLVDDFGNVRPSNTQTLFWYRGAYLTLNHD